MLVLRKGGGCKGGFDGSTVGCKNCSDCVNHVVQSVNAQVPKEHDSDLELDIIL